MSGIIQNSLACTLVQLDTDWHQPQTNRETIEKLLASAATKPVAGGLIVLPETFNSGFSMAGPAIAEPENGPTQQWMQTLADRYRCTIAGSVYTQIESAVFNRMLWVQPSSLSTAKAAQCTHYDKKFLFPLSEEHRIYTPSQARARIEFEIGNWRFRPAICYDLRFTQCSDQNPDQPYDVFLVVANWPAPRRKHWLSLLAARAIENQAFVIGVNRVGRDENPYTYAGDSVVIDPNGETLLQMTSEQHIGQAVLNHDVLENTRAQIPVLQSRREHG